MTEERKILIARFQKWLDTHPHPKLIASQCATIAEEYAERKVKNLGLFSVVPSISSKYDCDDCKHFPCHSNQDNYGSKSKPVERGICGDHSIKT